MTVDLSEMIAEHVDGVLALWRGTEGVAAADASPESVTRFLDRNDGLSLVAHKDGRLVGAVLAGHDGHRGYLWHLAVADSHRRRGAGRQLVEAALARLRAAGIRRCHILVLASNPKAGDFWKALGFFDRPDVRLMSVDLSSAS